MNIKISKTTKITTGASVALICKKNSKFSDIKLTSAEKKYIGDKLKEDEKLVTINQYNQWIFVCVMDDKKTGYELIEAARRAASKIHGAIKKNKIEDIIVMDEDKKPELALAFAEGLALTDYRFMKYFTKDTKDKKSHLKHIRILSSCSAHDIDRLQTVTQAVYIARDLINEPVSFLNAEQLSKEIRNMGKEAGFNVEVFNKQKIEALKMGGLLAVNKGSVDPPTFTICEWKPKNAKNKKPLVLVGKGIVYDTGGLSLKPTPDSMEYMKSDMSGAAAVAGIFYAAAKTGLPIHMVGLIPATDNRPGGNAYAPGDVVTMFDGSTVEMLNSDAEGRMILADALSYAKKYNPQLVIDLATLTGAASVAIGPHGLVAMGNADEKIFGKLKQSGCNVYERIVEFPMWEDYNEMIKSEIADIKNIGGRYAGAITAGKFLEHFTDYPWIHLDIAGPAFNTATDHYKVKGGVGIGIRLLYDFIGNNF